MSPELFAIFLPPAPSSLAHRDVHGSIHIFKSAASLSVSVKVSIICISPEAQFHLWCNLLCISLCHHCSPLNIYTFTHSVGFLCQHFATNYYCTIRTRLGHRMRPLWFKCSESTEWPDGISQQHMMTELPLTKCINHDRSPVPFAVADRSSYLAVVEHRLWLNRPLLPITAHLQCICHHFQNKPLQVATVVRL